MLALATALCAAYVLPAPLQHGMVARRSTVVMATTFRLNNYMLPAPIAAAGDIVLVKLSQLKDDTSRGGLVLAASQRKVRDGIVVSCGPGLKHPGSGAVLPTGFAVGDHVVCDDLEMEGEKVTYLGAPHRILPAARIVGKLEGGVMSMLTFRPMGDRLLVNLPKPADTTMSGIVLAGLEEGELPTQGFVVAAGPGRLNAKAEPNPMPAGVGDFVIFTKYGGAEIDFEDGNKYTVVTAGECLGTFAE